jgi:hypothetical protein
VRFKERQKAAFEIGSGNSPATINKKDPRQSFVQGTVPTSTVL